MFSLSMSLTDLLFTIFNIIFFTSIGALILARYNKSFRDLISPLLKSMFGDFTEEEFKKYAFLGVIFGLIIGIYWGLRPLKDDLFQNITGAEMQPRAKGLSLVVMAILVPIYSWLATKLKREQLFYVLSAVYGSLGVLFGALMLTKAFGLGLPIDPSRILGWAWYVYVESFGSLIVALFWAFAQDISTDESAKKGFSLIVMFGQVGGIYGPHFLTKIPEYFKISQAYPVLICGLLMFLIIPLVKFFIASMPQDELHGFHGKDEAQVEKQEEAEEPGFIEGLRLLLTQPYLLGIFAITTFYEIIVTIVDYYFKLMASTHFAGNDLAKTAFLGDYAVSANLITFFCLFLGISNITRRLGIRSTLAIVPFVVFGAVVVFMRTPDLYTLFWLMVGAKGINYALNGPAIKQLYIPTTKETRYKAQAWIESFGSRGAKGMGAGLNELHKNVLVWKNGPEWASKSFMKANLFKHGIDLGTYWYITLLGYFSFGLIAVWLFVALFLGKTYKKATDNKEVVC